MGNNDPGERSGGLIISKEVLAAIAVTAAKDVEGVGCVVPCLPEFLRFLPGNAAARFVRIAGGDTELIIDIIIKLKTGAKIAPVCTKVQNAVKSSLQNMTGKTVNKVNITIAGVYNK
ncbi:MAG: Asp23/Gls24 family envelope stress response protein [Oscillospiraceae bacterium]|jgi:uncharacterized alkaline shock family protein YloU|nr:Asp23/Gls24 family envelope stress response protein [Oscillospiraceae bacterium]